MFSLCNTCVLFIFCVRVFILKYGTCVFVRWLMFFVFMFFGCLLYALLIYLLCICLCLRAYVFHFLVGTFLALGWFLYLIMFFLVLVIYFVICSVGAWLIILVYMFVIDLCSLDFCFFQFLFTFKYYVYHK